MSQTKPYQPLAFRLLHGLIGVLILIAIATGVLIYNAYDGRLGHLPIPTVPKIMGIHKLFGRIFLLGMPIFALYSFHVGRRRLLQPDSIQQLSVAKKPIWWYTLHRFVNTLLLLAATFALVSGREMNEDWMARGELTHLWYSLHLASWAIMAICIMAHLLMSIRVGGIPLLLSMLHLRSRAYDRLPLLIQSMRSWISPKWIVTFLKSHLSLLRDNLVLLGVELIVMLGTLFAFISLIPHRG